MMVQIDVKNIIINVYLRFSTVITNRNIIKINLWVFNLTNNEFFENFESIQNNET